LPNSNETGLKIAAEREVTEIFVLLCSKIVRISGKTGEDGKEYQSKQVRVGEFLDAWNEPKWNN